MTQCHYVDTGVTCLIILCEERGRNRPWISGALIYEGVKLEGEGKLV